MLNINTKAPDFELLDTNNNKVCLHDFIGKKVVLYFYPKDNTPGCTSQAINFKEEYEKYKKDDIVVIGISKDSIASHIKFQGKYELPFILLSDPDKIAIQAYDCWKQKSLYGKAFMGVVRTTYVINEKGIIIDANDKVHASTNASDTLCILKK